MYAHAHAINPVQARIDRRHAERDWQADCAIASGLKTKLLDLIEEAQVLRDQRPFNSGAANDCLSEVVDYLDNTLADCIKPMEAAIAETEPGEGPDALPGMPRML